MMHSLPEPRDARTALRTGLPLAAVVLLGLALRLYDLDGKSLWIDEAFTAWMSQMSPSAIIQEAVALDQHPPLYYLMVHLWTGLQPGESALRGFSVLCGVATIPVAYLIGRVAAGPGLGLLAALLFAVSPLHIAYAQQARMYSMLTFFAALTTLLVLMLLVRDRRASVPEWWWICFPLALMLTMLSHNTAVLVPVALAIFLSVTWLCSRIRSRTRLDVCDGAHAIQLTSPSRVQIRALAAGTVIGIMLWLPWAPAFISQSLRVDAEFWLQPPTIDDVMGHWRNLSAAYSPQQLFVPINVASAGLLAIGCWRLRQRNNIAVLLLILLVVPAVAELLVSLRRPIFYSQTLIWTALPLIVLVAAGALHPRRRAIVVPVIATLLVVELVSVRAYYRTQAREDWPAAVRYVSAVAHPGDLVLFNAGWTELAFSYYYPADGPSLERHGLPVDLFDRGILEPKMSRADIYRLDTLIRGRPNVWLVYSHEWYTDPDRIAADHLEQVLGRTDSHYFTQIEVHQYGSK